MMMLMMETRRLDAQGRPAAVVNSFINHLKENHPQNVMKYWCLWNRIWNRISRNTDLCMIYNVTAGESMGIQHLAVAVFFVKNWTCELSHPYAALLWRRKLFWTALKQRLWTLQTYDILYPCDNMDWFWYIFINNMSVVLYLIRFNKMVML